MRGIAGLRSGCGFDRKPPRFEQFPDPKPGEKFHINIASGYNFDELWHSFTEVIQACVERAKAHGMKFSIENHTHTMLPVTDTFLRLCPHKSSRHEAVI